jgi:hypothetical protein
MTFISGVLMKLHQRSNQSLKPTLPGAIPSFLMTTALPQIAKLGLGQRGLAPSR